MSSKEAFAKLASALNMDVKRLEAAVGLQARGTQPRRMRPSGDGGRRPWDNSEEQVSASLLDETRREVVEEHLLALILTHDNEAYEALKRLKLLEKLLEIHDHHFWNPENREMWRMLNSVAPPERADIILTPEARRLRASIPVQLDRRGQGKALRDVVYRICVRQLKRDIEEAALAIASLAEEDDADADTLRGNIDEMKHQSIVKLEQLRAVDTGRWNRDNRHA